MHTSYIVVTEPDASEEDGINVVLMAGALVFILAMAAVAYQVSRRVRRDRDG